MDEFVGYVVEMMLKVLSFAGYNAEVDIKINIHMQRFSCGIKQLDAKKL